MNKSFSSILGLVRPARLVFAGVAVACCTSVYAGKIVVDNDEWTLSDAGFGAEGAANGTAYAQNAAAYLTGGSGPVLIYSDNFGLDSASLQTALTLGGYGVTEDPSVATPFTAASLSAYKAVFLGGDALSSAEISALTTYENHGGGVYIAAGTGTIPGGSVAEAAQWNSFLNSYGLSLGSVYNGIVGDITVVSTSPVLAGVAQLYYNNGNTVSASGSARVITYDGTEGLIGTYSSSSATVPDGASTALLAGLSAALVLFGARRLRFNSETNRV
jgi:hypothetical protein